MQPGSSVSVPFHVMRRLVCLFVCVYALGCSIGSGVDHSFGSGGSAGIASTGSSPSASGDATNTGNDATDDDSTGVPNAEGDLSGTSSQSSGTAEGWLTEASAGDELGTTHRELTTDDSNTGASVPGEPLHPDLEVPERGQPCQTPGSGTECPFLHVCRFYTTDEGRCEGCEACGNLNAPCQSGSDCDILFACFQGRCTNFCMLGTHHCGPIEHCVDVGHPTHGVCDPYAGA